MAQIEQHVTESEKKGKYAGGAFPAGEAGGEEQDELFPAGVDVILDLGQASVSLLQRRLKPVSYTHLDVYKRQEQIMDEKKEPTLLQQRKKDLFFSPTNGYDRLAPGEEEDIQAYCAGYKTFLDEGKTERECVDYAIGLAEAAGFRPLVRGEKLRPGDKVYRCLLYTSFRGPAGRADRRAPVYCQCAGDRRRRLPDRGGPPSAAAWKVLYPGGGHHAGHWPGGQGV